MDKRTTFVEMAIAMEETSKFKTFLLSVFTVMFLFYPILVEQCARMVSPHGDMVIATGSFFFMCGGLREDRWFWEQIVMLRKAFMVLIVVFITHKATQTYCGMWLIGTMLLLNALNEPYSQKKI